MIRVADGRAAAEFYTRVFGLRRSWEDDTAIGLVFPESDAEIVVHTDADIPSDVKVHYLMDDVVEATKAFVAGAMPDAGRAVRHRHRQVRRHCRSVRNSPLHAGHDAWATDTGCLDSNCGDSC